MEYIELINGLNSGSIKEITLKVKDYGHYRNCKFVTERILKPSSFNNEYVYKIIIDLASNEHIEFYGPINEEEKIFDIKGKGRFTLKSMYKNIEIINVEYR